MEKEFQERLGLIEKNEARNREERHDLIDRALRRRDQALKELDRLGYFEEPVQSGAPIPSVEDRVQETLAALDKEIETLKANPASATRTRTTRAPRTKATRTTVRKPLAATDPRKLPDSERICKLCNVKGHTLRAHYFQGQNKKKFTLKELAMLKDGKLGKHSAQPQAV